MEQVGRNNAIEADACLYIVGMPLGNVGDLSPRAREVLAAVDCIACEDTRVTSLLLSQVGIKQRLLSYHEHNLAKRGPELLERLRRGERLALVSDAGMPAISDPGEKLVALVAEARIPICSVPGPTAAMTCLAASGLDSRQFYFEGFLATKGRDRQSALARIASSEATVILYEAPHRMEKTLADLVAGGLGDRRMVAGREITKRYEEYLRMEVEDLLDHLRVVGSRGEFTLILEGLAAYRLRRGDTAETATEMSEIELRTEIKAALEAGASQKTLLASLINEHGYKKNRAYDLILSVKDEML